jgi:CubicO group peptidase (beta-lactamase class C family)
VFHLLTHTSGLTYEPPDPALEAAYDDLDDGRYALPELMRRLDLAGVRPRLAEYRYR